MSLSFTIKPDGYLVALTFAGISLTNGRQAIDFDPGAEHQQQFRFHSPGVKGNFLVRDAAIGRAISVVVRYMNSTLNLAEADYQTDAAAFVTKQCEIVCHGITYKGCNVRAESMRRSSPMRPTGRAALQVFFNVTMTFTQDNPNGNS
jgi:hypothetical protein